MQDCPVAPPTPIYHTTGLGTGPHDANAIFNYRGTWHLMHQANWTDWAHLVSTDLAHWTRLPSALAPNGDWDGTLTLLDGKPSILYDCANLVPGCIPPNASVLPAESAPLHLAPNDPARVGVARPADYEDANLTKWIKDPHNPIHIQNGRPGQGPSNMWRTHDGRVTNMLMTQGRHGPLVRFQSTDPTLHNWTVAQPDPFFAQKSNGVAVFYPLPSGGNTSTDVFGSAGPTPTHLLGHVTNAPHEAGTPWLVIGTYDGEGTGGFTPTDAPMPLDSSELVVFSAFGKSDERLLYVGWFNGLGVSNTLTVPRQVTYDARMRRLLVKPVPELARALRGAPLGSTARTIIAAGASLALFDEGKAATAFDLRVTVALPDDGSRLTFGAAILAAPGSRTDAEVVLSVDVEARRQDSTPRTVRFSASVPGGMGNLAKKYPYKHYNTSVSFPLPGDQTALELHVLADNALVESFVGGGRGVVTSPVAQPGKEKRRATATLFAFDQPVGITRAEAAVMGCGWA